VNLGKPSPALRLSNPDGYGVIVIVPERGFVCGAAVERIDHVISGQCRVWRQNANLEIAKFVGLEFAVLQCDQERIESLNVLVNVDEVRCKQAVDGRKVALRHGRPEILFQLDDIDGGRKWRSGRGLRECSGSKQRSGNQQEETHANYLSVCLPLLKLELVSSSAPLEVWCLPVGRKRRRWHRGAADDRTWPLP
jgi:hypothetical protein